MLFIAISSGSHPVAACRFWICCAISIRRKASQVPEDFKASSLTRGVDLDAVLVDRASCRETWITCPRIGVRGEGLPELIFSYSGGAGITPPAHEVPPSGFARARRAETRRCIRSSPPGAFAQAPRIQRVFRSATSLRYIRVTYSA